MNLLQERKRRYSIASPYCMGHPFKITLLVKNGLSDFLEYSY